HRRAASSFRGVRPGRVARSYPCPHVLHGPWHRGTGEAARRGGSHLRVARGAAADLRRPEPRLRGPGGAPGHLAGPAGRRGRRVGGGAPAPPGTTVPARVPRGGNRST